MIINDYVLDYLLDYLFYKSGNKVVDEFIRHTQVNSNREVDIIEFVPYGQFRDIKIVTKFELYTATWIDGNIQSWNKKKMNFKRNGPRIVVLKRLNNSER